MTDFAESALSVELEGVGIFTNIESYRLDSSFLTPTDGWEFVVYQHDDPASLRRIFRPLAPVKLYVNGCLQVIGRIDGTEGAGESGASLRVWGRDYLADLVDGGVDPSLRFAQNTTLEEAILAITRPFGIARIEGDGFAKTRNLLTGKTTRGGNPGAAMRKASLADFRPEYGDGAWEIASRMAARHGLTLQPAASRDAIVLAEPDYAQRPLYTLRRGPVSQGQVLDGKARRDWSQVPTVTMATGRFGRPSEGVGSARSEVPTFGPGALTDFWKLPEVQRITNGTDGASPLTIGWRWSPKHAAEGNTGLLYRPMFFRDADSRTQDQLNRVVRRLLAEKLRLTLEYSCKMSGHADPETGAVFAVDTMAHVTDGVEDVDEPMWVVERSFSSDARQGPTTELTLIRPESYVL